MAWKITTLTASATMLAAPAMAADLPAISAPPAPPPLAIPFSWTGLYLGANGGFAWDSPHTSASFGSVGNMTTKWDGAIAGIQVGYNYQFGAFVLGAEADLDYADLHQRYAATSSSFPGYGYSEQFSSKTDWFGTARVRLGFTPTERLFLYGTGGLAYGHNETDYIRDDAYLGEIYETDQGSRSSTQIGWAAGAGAEWALTNDWSLKAEYLRVDLGKAKTGVTEATGEEPGTPIGTVSSQTSFNVVRGGINYKF